MITFKKEEELNFLFIKMRLNFEFSVSTSMLQLLTKNIEVIFKTKKLSYLNLKLEISQILINYKSLFKILTLLIAAIETICLKEFSF